MTKESFDPDDLEGRLEQIRIQAEAGRADDALRVLEELQGQVPPDFQERLERERQEVLSAMEEIASPSAEGEEEAVSLAPDKPEAEDVLDDAMPDPNASPEREVTTSREEESREGSEIPALILDSLERIEREVQNLDYQGATAQVQSMIEQSPPEYQEFLRGKKQDIGIRWEEHLQRIAEQVDEALAQFDQPVPAEIDVWLEEYRAIAPDGPDAQKRLMTWVETLSRRRQRLSLEEELTCLRGELEELRRPGVMDAKKGEVLLERVTALYGSHSESGEVGALLQHVKAYYDEAREAEGKQVTAFQTAEFETLIREYEEAQQRGEESVRRLVPEIDEGGRLVFEWNEELGREFIRLRPLGEERIEPGQAIAEARQHAASYARRKGREKLSFAQESLLGNPRQAEQLVQEALGLFLLPDRLREELETFREEQLRPALELREKAEVMRDAALREVDIVAAWEQLAHAAQLDPNLPRTAGARSQLRPRLVAHLDREMERAHVARRRRDWKKARALAEPLLELVLVDEALAERRGQLETLLDSCAKLQRQDVHYREVIQEVQSLLEKDIDRADEILRLLEEDLRGDVDVYPQVKNLRDRLDARLRVEDLLKRAERAWIDGNREEMSRMLGVLQEGLETKKYSRPVRRRVREWGDRLDARCLLREAERGMGLLDPRGLRRDLQRVIDLLKGEGDDCIRARDLLGKLEEDEQVVRRAETILTRAKEHLMEGLAGRVESFRSSWSLLGGLEESNPPEATRRQVAGLREEVRRAWVEQLERDIATHRTQPPDRWDVELMEGWLSTLKEVSPALGERRERELLHRCYVIRANRGLSDEDALCWWEQARKLATPSREVHQEIEDGWREAKKRQVFAEVARHGGDPGWQTGSLKGLLDEIPYDPEVHLELARLQLKQEHFDEAEGVIEEARRALRRLQQEEHPLTSQIEELHERIKRERALEQCRSAIAERLRQVLGEEASQEGHPDQIDQIRKDYERLRRRRQYKEYREELEAWWDDLRSSTLVELQERYEDIQRRGAPVWLASRPLVIGLRLYPGWAVAQRVVDDLAKAVAVGDLAQRVDRALRDKVGPLPTEGREHSLRRQITNVDTLLEEALGCQEILHCAWGTDREFEVDEAVQRLQGLRWDLVELQNGIGSLLGLLQQVAAIGTQHDWEEIERQLNSLTSGPFQRHRQVLFVEEFCQRVRKRRQQLEAFREELPAAVEAEEFGRALLLIRELRESGDPDPQSPELERRFDYGFASFNFPLAQNWDVGLGELEEILHQRQEQVEHLEKWWQEPLEDLLPWNPYPAEWEEWLGRDLRVEGAGVCAEVSCRVRRGEFVEALLLTTEAIGVSDEAAFERACRLAERLDAGLAYALQFLDEKRVGPTTLEHYKMVMQELLGLCRRAVAAGPKQARRLESRFAGPYLGVSPLRRAVQHLQEEPSTEEDLESKRARDSLAQGSSIRDVLLEWLMEARQRMQEIVTKSQQFRDQVRLLQTLLPELEHVRRRRREELSREIWSAFTEACQIIENDPSDPKCGILRQLLVQLE